MKKSIIVLTAMIMMIGSQVTAKEKINVFSRFDFHVTSAMVARTLLQEVEKNSNYEFKISVVPGSGGESADRRLYEESKLEGGDKSVVIGASSSWSRNYFMHGNSIPRDNLIPLIGHSGAPFAIHVPKTSKINSLKELVQHIKESPKAFHGTTTANSTSKFFEQLFRDKYNLTNVKQLAYRKSSQLLMALQGNEVTFAFYITADSRDATKMIVISTEERLAKYPNLKTGREVGFDEFNFTTLSTLATFSKNKEFINDLSSKLVETCKNNPNIKKLFEMGRSFKYCYGTDYVTMRVQKERKMYSKYKELFKKKKK